ncbi:MAG: chorismate synthase [Candidatus Omnitrophica bacterium]|nr:chorismate synthase [Candidatus Omnitrophota bacterium]
MAGNIFGDIFRVTTFGESHGAAIGCVIDGVPPGLMLSQVDIQKDLDRRKPGQSEVTTQRQESDTVEILSGIFEDKTTGAPLALLIRNSDQRSKDYDALKDVFRPGHADQTLFQKFGFRDHRGGGRSSGRETAARVAAGAVAKKVLSPHHIQIIAYTKAIGTIEAKVVDLAFIDKNIVRTADPSCAEQMIKRINEAREQGDSVGGVIEVMVKGCPVGLGDPVFDKLEAKLSHAMMSIGATKGVEFGAGFGVTKMMGSESNDKVSVDQGQIRTQGNLAGGISGGISNGEDIIFRLAVKPTSSIAKKQNAVAKDGNLTSIEIKGRHDPCLCPRIVPVVEAMTALVIADCLLIQKTIK